MTTAQPPVLDGFRKIATDLAESQRRKAEGEHNRIMAEITAQRHPATGSIWSQPASDTDGQRSRWSQMEWREGGENHSNHGVNEA